MNSTKFVLLVSVLAYWNGVDSARITSKRDLNELRTSFESPPSIDTIIHQVYKFIFIDKGFQFNVAVAQNENASRAVIGREQFRDTVLSTIRLVIPKVMKILERLHLPPQIMYFLETIANNFLNANVRKLFSGISKRAIGDEFSLTSLFPSFSDIFGEIISQVLKPLQAAINATLTGVSNSLLLLYNPVEGEGFIAPIIQFAMNKTVLKVIEIIAKVQDQIANYLKNLTASFFGQSVFLPILQDGTILRLRRGATNATNITAVADSNLNDTSDNDIGTNLPSGINVQDLATSSFGIVGTTITTSISWLVTTTVSVFKFIVNTGLSIFNFFVNPIRWFFSFITDPLNRGLKSFINSAIANVSLFIGNLLLGPVRSILFFLIDSILYCSSCSEVLRMFI